MPVVTLAVFVICRSALVTRLIAVVLVLLLGVGSGVVLVMPTVFVIVPAPVPTSTVSVIVPLVFAARLAVVTVMLVALVTKPTEPELRLIAPDCTVRPAALKSSVSVTLVAALGPAFVNVMM